MTDLDRPVTRRLPAKVRGRRLVVTLQAGGLSLRLERTRGSLHVDWERLWRWVETAQIYIPPRTK